MIQIEINKSSLQMLEKTLKNQVSGMYEVTNPRSLEEIGKAAFVISGKQFIRQIAINAKANPKKLHHIYEWNKVGVTKHRLFILKRSAVRGGELRVSSSFLTSRVPVPISPELRDLGVNSQHIFRKKAEVMESGRSTNSFSAKNAKALVFIYKEKLYVLKKPRSVSIKNPGGKQTTGAFEREMRKWFKTPNIESAMKASGISEKLNLSIEKALNSKNGGQVQVRSAIRTVCQSYYLTAPEEGKVL